MPPCEVRELDKVLVKGKEQPVVIYKPVALESDLDDDARESSSFGTGYSRAIAARNSSRSKRAQWHGRGVR